MQKIIRLIVGSFAVFLAEIPAYTSARAKVPETVQSYMDSQGRSGFSGVILVAQNGQLTERAYGSADREWDIANRPSTRFKIGSLTKQFTAGAMLLLEQDGKLKLDDPLCRYVASCPEAWRPIRLEQLLNHSSGIPDFVRLPGMRERFTRHLDLDEIIRIIAAQPLDFAPGADARYGNSGFLLSAKVIEIVSGKSYADFLRDRLYNPLRMTGSGYAHDARIIPERARGYVSRDGRIENAPYIDMSIPIGAGSQFSTARDLYIWDRALRQPGLFTAHSLAKMFQPRLGGFGLGWEVTMEHGHRVIQHNGDINGFGSFIARYPNDDAVIIVLTNIEGTKVREVKDELASRLLGSD